MTLMVLGCSPINSKDCKRNFSVMYGSNWNIKINRLLHDDWNNQKTSIKIKRHHVLYIFWLKSNSKILGSLTPPIYILFSLPEAIFVFELSCCWKAKYIEKRQRTREEITYHWINDESTDVRYSHISNLVSRYSRNSYVVATSTAKAKRHLLVD